MDEFGILDEDDFGAAKKSSSRATINGQQGHDVNALKDENLSLKAEVEKLKAELAKVDRGLNNYNCVRQRPVAHIKFHHMSKQLRRRIDSAFQRPSRDMPLLHPDAPKPRVPAVKEEENKKEEQKMNMEDGEDEEEGEIVEDDEEKKEEEKDVKQDANKDANEAAEQGSVQYFETFCIDRVGIRNMPTNIYQAAEADSFDVPSYDGPENVYALPMHIIKDGKKVVQVPRGCFNCGQSGHSIAQCPQPKEDQCVRHNSRLLREHPVSSKKRERYRGRYYDQEHQDEEEVDSLKNKDAPPQEPSGIRVIDDASRDEVTQQAKRQRTDEFSGRHSNSSRPMDRGGLSNQRHPPSPYQSPSPYNSGRSSASPSTPSSSYKYPPPPFGAPLLYPPAYPSMPPPRTTAPYTPSPSHYRHQQSNTHNTPSPRHAYASPHANVHTPSPSGSGRHSSYPASGSSSHQPHARRDYGHDDRYRSGGSGSGYRRDSRDSYRR